jgi:hypothetical protein
MRSGLSAWVSARPILVFTAALACAPAIAEAQLVLYDDFSAPQLDETRWIGREIGGGVLEIQREIQNERLTLQVRVRAGLADPSHERVGENALVPRRSKQFDEIAFHVAVRKADVSACASGEESVAAARGVYPLFNDGTGDVVAIIAAERSSAAAPGDLDVVGSLVHRSDAGDALLGSVHLGSAVVGQWMRLRVKWAAAASAVRYQKDAEPVSSIEYTNAVVAAPAAPRKYLGAQGVAGGCPSATASSSLVAAFDNVRVNP